MKNTYKKRLFLCTNLPSVVRYKLFSMANAQELSNCNAVRIIEKEKLHLTILFLGNIAETEISLIINYLSGIEIKSFDIAIENRLYFSPENPAIIFVRILKYELGLEPLRAKLMRDFGDMGLNINRDNRQFFPHITLGRIKHVKNIGKNFINFLDETTKIEELRFGNYFYKAKKPGAKTGFINFRCNSVILMESIHGNDSAVYKDIYVRKLL